jgi:hypothetical protein
VTSPADLRQGAADQDSSNTPPARAPVIGHRLKAIPPCVDEKKVSAMRVLLKASMDTEKANEFIRNGTMGKLLQESLEQIKPEAAYFTSDHGKRTAFLVFDMQDSSQMPVLSEPFFLQLNAEITYTPVMNVEDVQKGLSQLGR